MGMSDYKISNPPGFVLVERARDYEVVLDEQPAALSEIAAFCKKAGTLVAADIEAWADPAEQWGSQLLLY